MFCRHCGKENDDNSNFCRGCGKPLSTETDASNMQAQPAVNYQQQNIIDLSEYTFKYRYAYSKKWKAKLKDLNARLMALPEQERIKATEQVQKKFKKDIMIANIKLFIIIVVIGVVIWAAISLHESKGKKNISYDSIDGYSASDIQSIPKYDCQLITFNAMQPYESYRNLFNERFGEGEVEDLFLTKAIHWKDDDGKHILLSLVGSNTVLIHSRADLETVGVDILLEMLK